MQPAKALFPMLVTESGTLMLFRALHPTKAKSPMLVTESGMAMLSKDQQSAKALSRMLVIESGMLMFFKDRHFAKALSPMLVTESGMLIFSKDRHFAKALSPMLVTESGMAMLSKNKQSAKALSPMQLHPGKVISSLDLLESGMTTFTSPQHPLKASSEICVTSWGIITPKGPAPFTSCRDAASISLLVYTTLTSDSASNISNPTSFNVWASFSKLLPWNSFTMQIFCSIGSSQGYCSRSISFSCWTVWIVVTSRARTSPRKVITFRKGMATDGCN